MTCKIAEYREVVQKYDNINILSSFCPYFKRMRPETCDDYEHNQVCKKKLVSFNTEVVYLSCYNRNFEQVEMSSSN